MPEHDDQTQSSDTPSDNEAVDPEFLAWYREGFDQGDLEEPTPFTDLRDRVDDLEHQLSQTDDRVDVLVDEITRMHQERSEMVTALNHEIESAARFFDVLVTRLDASDERLERLADYQRELHQTMREMIAATNENTTKTEDFLEGTAALLRDIDARLTRLEDRLDLLEDNQGW